MVVPTGDFCDLLLAYWTDAVFGIAIGLGVCTYLEGRFPFLLRGDVQKYISQVGS